MDTIGASRTAARRTVIINLTVVCGFNDTYVFHRSALKQGDFIIDRTKGTSNPLPHGYSLTESEEKTFASVKKTLNCLCFLQGDPTAI
jgi:hypothetical protein